MPRLLSLCVSLALALPLAAAAQPILDPDRKDKKEAAPEDVQAAVRREVEKAKAELRDEVRAELQAQQSAKEFLDGPTQGEKPKLQLLQLDGALRVRGDLLDDLTLRRSPDAGGYFLFPPPPLDPCPTTQACGTLPGAQNRGGTQTSANLRLRLEPIVNVSEQVRVLFQVDVLDGVVLGSTPGSTGQTPPVAGSGGIDRDSIRVKRAWGEVQTPVGLLSFGRMPAHWGLGMMSNAGSGLDDDLGDNVDRLQLAIPVRNFPVPVVLVPYYDIVRSGLVSQNLSGVGQPFSLTKADEGWTLGAKALKIDTDEELSRKLARGEASWSAGAFYGYHAQRSTLSSTGATPGTPSNEVSVDEIKTGLTYHSLDLWGRYRTKRLRLEAEAAWIYGSATDLRPDAAADTLARPANLRQLAVLLQTDYRPRDGKWLLGLEAGFASGDPSPGMGNHPERFLRADGTAPPGPAVCTSASCPWNGWIDAPQYLSGKDVRNFRFNAAYRVDEILWREILGNLTDAWYLKPTVRFDVLDGLWLKTGLMYSQAIFASSTPSGVHKPLGVELDTSAHYASDDGFNAWLSWGWLFPLEGLSYGYARLPADHNLVRAHAVRAGLAIKF